MRRLPHGLLAITLAAGPAAAQAPAGPDAAQAPADAAPAEKQLTAQEQAAVYFEKGRAFFKAKDYRSAAEQFQAAYNLDPVPILLYNMARAAEEMGDPEKAIVHYQSYLKRIGPDAEDRGEVQRRIRVMEKTIAAARRARIRVVGMPLNAQITIDGQPAELEDGLVRAEPGERVLEVTPANGQPWTRTLGLSTGEYVELAFGEVEAPPPPPEGMSALAIAGWSTLGAGALFGALGGVFYAEALTASDDRDAAIASLRATSDSDAQRALVADKDEATERYDNAGTAAYVLWGLGAAALVGGGAMLALEYGVFGGGAPTEAAIVPLPGGVGLIGRF